MEYSITNLAVDNIGENVYVKAFAEGVEMEQRKRLPLVSVLLASYNHEKYVEAAVRSIMNQKGVDFELIVIDDGSTDRSPEILEQLRLELGFTYIHRPNKGFIATMNELLSHAHGKYYCSFASDDIMPRDRLYKQSKFLSAHPDKVACFGQILPMHKDGTLASSVDPRYLKSVPSVSFEELFLAKKALHGCAEMLDREKIQALGGYDIRFHFEDYPLYLKILKQYGPQPVLADVICCHYRESDGSMHSQTNKMYKAFLEIIEDYHDHPLYRKAVNVWKANWFSALAYDHKWQAFLALPQLASASLSFLKRFPKLLIPRVFLKY